jgi:UDP-glucose 4-epimerase
MKRCLVTGGAGFIGYHLVEVLIKQGYYVTVIDYFSNGKVVNLESSHLFGQIRVIHTDVSDHHVIAPIFELIEHNG